MIGAVHSKREGIFGIHLNSNLEEFKKNIAAVSNGQPRGKQKMNERTTETDIGKHQSEKVASWSEMKQQQATAHLNIFLWKI